MLQNWLSTIHPSWRSFIDTQFARLEQIGSNINQISADANILPHPSQVFRCLSIALSDVKVVIVGQDPYPNSNHACGLAFAIGESSVTLPKSLKNIQIELCSDLGCVMTEHLDLAAWHLQGVMLLNRVLTINEGATNSHANIGWEDFTLELLKYIDANRQVVAILWGNTAMSVEAELPNARIVKSAHPSPLSAYRGFFGSRPFSETNKHLLELRQTPIDWCRATVDK
jgi:uracil-DNA glycosylase